MVIVAADEGESTQIIFTKFAFICDIFPSAYSFLQPTK